MWTLILGPEVGRRPGCPLMQSSSMPTLGRARVGWPWHPSPARITLTDSLQVTLSYGMFENKRNAVHVKGPFSVEADPSR